MNECKHKWVFQETKRKKFTTYDRGDYYAHFHKIDIYYCENCCEIKTIEKKERVSLPFGGSRCIDKFAPTWY